METIINSIVSNIPFIVVTALGFYFWTKNEVSNLKNEVSNLKNEFTHLEGKVEIIKDFEINIKVQEERLKNMEKMFQDLSADLKEIKNILIKNGK